MLCRYLPMMLDFQGSVMEAVRMTVAETSTENSLTDIAVVSLAPETVGVEEVVV